MRVTFVTINYWPSIGGAQSHVRHVAEGLVARHDHTVEVLTTDALRPPGGSDPGRVDIGEEELGGVIIRRAPVARRAHTVLRTYRRVARRLGRTRSPGPLGLGPLGARMATEAIRCGRRSDTVVGVPSPYLTLWLAERAARHGQAAFVAMPLLHLAAGEPPPWVLRSLHRADGCTSSTNDERNWLLAHGLRPERVALLPPGCDPVAYRRMEPEAARAELGVPQRPTVGYLGRLAAHKGLDTLAAAMDRLWSAGAETNLLIAGNDAGWEGFGALEAELKERGGDRAVVRGPFGDDDRDVLLAACDVVVLPSREESFGMGIVEAGCARRPVVASDIPSVRCVVRPGTDGDLVPVDDPVALTAAIADLLSDSDRRRRYGEAGRRRAEQEFSWDRIVDGWDAFLRECVDRRRHAGTAGSSGGR